MLQWLVFAGRFDIHYSVCSLSRFQVAPRNGHLKLARKVMGYLRKFPRRGYTVNSSTPKFDMDMDKVKLNQDFGNQYHYFTEDIDPIFPEALVQELEINVFVDADHGHDKVTGRSVTGIFAFLDPHQSCHSPSVKKVYRPQPLELSLLH